MDRYAKRKLTKAKRKTQTCKVYSTKIDKSHLSKASLNHLSTLFKEAKWFYNYCLSQKNINDSDTTIKSVLVKVKDVYEDRPFTVLGADMKQSIKERLIGSLISLHALKEKGYKVGRLKFKSFINSVPLRKLNHTYYVKKNRIRISGMKAWIRIHGLHQIPEDAEIANAVLVRKNDNYYINITTYTNKKKEVPEASIGIDFGCETQLTFTNRIKVVFEVPITKRLKRLDRKIQKNKRKPSKNRRKDQAKRRKEYEYLTNQKRDIRNKVVNAITTNYKYVNIQDESIHAWAMSGHGKKIQNTAIGSILSDLKNKSVLPIVVSKWFPSTQLCPQCNTKNKLSLSERVYKCSCGYIEDRDIKSALCIEAEGMKTVPMDYREKLEETATSTFYNTLSKINGIVVSKLKSLSQEAASLR